MAKKKKISNNGKLLAYASVVLGLVAVCMVFVAAVTTGTKEVGALTIEATQYSGLQVAFGYAKNDVAILGFSFLALLPVVLALAGTVIAVLNAVKGGSKVLDFVVAACFVVAGVLYFIMPSFMVFAETIPGAAASFLEFKLGAGAVVAAICALLAGLASLAKPFVKK